MDNVLENSCTSVFVHNTEELSEAFTTLWTQLINEKERCENENVILQTNVSGV